MLLLLLLLLSMLLLLLLLPKAVWLMAAAGCGRKESCDVSGVSR